MLLINQFPTSQTLGIIAAMTSNYFLNNIITFQERKLKSLDLIRGLFSFYLICSLGAFANIAIATYVFVFHLIGLFQALLVLASALFGILHSHLFLLGSLSEKMKGKAYNQTHLLIFLFIIFCLTKLTVIKHIPLINDEAYTLTISRYFSLSYFDHPPLMMWVSYFLHLLEIFQLNIFRIPFIAFGLLTSFFLYKIRLNFIQSRLEPFQLFYTLFLLFLFLRRSFYCTRCIFKFLCRWCNLYSNKTDF